MTIPESTVKIEGSAFSRCSNLTSVTIPDGVEEIGSCAFQECGSLTSVSIPDSVVKIGDGAFLGCRNLATVDIPNPMCTVADNAFRGTLLEKRREQKVETWRAQGLCQHCGGDFVNGICFICGRRKDY